MVKQGQQAVQALSEEASSGQSQALGERLDELTSSIKTLRDTRDALRLVLDGSDDRYVYSAGIDRRYGQESFELTAELLDVGSEIASRWYPEVSSVAYSSATIAVGEEFTHFNHEVGLDRLDSSSFTTLRLSSSYDFENNMSVLVASDMPEPNAPAISRRLRSCSSTCIWAWAARRLRSSPTAVRWSRSLRWWSPSSLAMGSSSCARRGGSNARQLRDRFVADESSSLFALKSFWEGFDAAGNTLRCVVIPKLPFQRPTDPVSCERDRREPRAWARYSLPEAVLSVKQAAGRLIRTSTDRGCLVLADARLLTKGYGKVFLGALPKRSYEKVPTGQMRAALERWCERQPHG